ncbi:MAG: thioredoxin fold domain-containing protein, partial [Hydrogenophilaceae bacterium]
MRTIITLLLLGWLPAALAADGHPAKGAYLGGIETEYPAWFKDSFLDLRADIAEARQAGRRVVLLFSQDNCPYCNALVERNLAQREIEATLKAHFEVIALNLWGDREVTGLDGKIYTEKAFGVANKVQFTPTLVFLDEQGQVVLRLNGYVPPARFKAALDWVADRGEARQPFRDYVAGLEQAELGQGELIAEPFFRKTADLRRRGKAARPLAVFFEQRDCPDCATLHRRVLADPDVQRQLARF